MINEPLWRGGHPEIYYGIYYGTNNKGLQIISVSPCFVWLPKAEEVGHWDESVKL